MNKEKVLEALAAWIVRVTSENTVATPEELAVLPEVARVYLESVQELALLGDWVEKTLKENPDLLKSD